MRRILMRSPTSSSWAGERCGCYLIGRTTARKRSYNISDALTAHGQLPESDLLALLRGEDTPPS